MNFNILMPCFNLEKSQSEHNFQTIKLNQKHADPLLLLPKK
jgi:hypothetical protein